MIYLILIIQKLKGLTKEKNKFKCTIKKVGIACGDMSDTPRYNLRHWPYFKHLVKLLKLKGTKVLFLEKKVSILKIAVMIILILIQKYFLKN